MIFAISALPCLTVPGWFAGLGRAFPVAGAVASLYRVLIAVSRPPRCGAPAFRLGERTARTRSTLARY